MGYTHYYRRTNNEPAGAYAALGLDVKKIFAWAEEHGIDIANPTYDESVSEPAELSEGMIRFNGGGTRDLSHETFLWPASLESHLLTEIGWCRENGRDPRYDERALAEYRAGESHFSFCKTARKPYDAIVCAVLIRAKVHYGASVEISSDGSWEHEWTTGPSDWGQPDARISTSGASVCIELFGAADNPM